MIDNHQHFKPPWRPSTQPTPRTPTADVRGARVAPGAAVRSADDRLAGASGSRRRRAAALGGPGPAHLPLANPARAVSGGAGRLSSVAHAAIRLSRRNGRRHPGPGGLRPGHRQPRERPAAKAAPQNRSRDAASGRRDLPGVPGELFRRVRPQTRAARRSIPIIQRTWKKMSESGHAAALQLPLDPESRKLVEAALAGESR